MTWGPMIWQRYQASSGPGRSEAQLRILEGINQNSLIYIHSRLWDKLDVDPALEGESGRSTDTLLHNLQKPLTS